MQTKTSKELTERDFAYVYEPGIGQTYQNGPYVILAGRNSYACTYRGLTFSWGLEFLTEAIEACARHEARRKEEGKNTYTHRCEQAEAGLLPRMGRKEEGN